MPYVYGFSQRPEEGVRTSGTGGTGGYELGTELGSPVRALSVINH